MSRTPDPEVVITVGEDGMAEFDSIAERLAAKGLTNANSLPGIGVITGNAAGDAMDALRAEPGIASVELAGGVQLPPPDSDVQ